MLMGCFGSFGASASLKIHSFENGCSYVHNISQNFWKARKMVWGCSVPAAPCAQVSSAAQTVSAIQSGVNIVVYQATCPYPSTGSRYEMANVSQSHLSSNKGLSCTWDTMGNPAQSRGTPCMMCQWLEQMKRSKRRIYLKMFLRLWAIKILLSLLPAMGFSITTSNGVLAQDLPHITSNCSDKVCFQPVSSSPRLLSHLMCLTIFTWMLWDARPLV